MCYLIIISCLSLFRAKCTGASLTWCQQSMTPQHPLWLWTTPMYNTETRLTLHRTAVSICFPLSTIQRAPGMPQNNVSTQSPVLRKFPFSGKHYFPLLSIPLSAKLIFPLAPPRPATPEKFTIPHRCARFGPGGHLVQVLPNLPSAGQPALVDIHNLEVLF